MSESTVTTNPDGAVASGPIPAVLAGLVPDAEKAIADLKKARQRAAIAKETANAKVKAAREAVKAAKAAAKASPKGTSDRDLVREIDAAIVQYAGALVAGYDLPDDRKATVATLVANQLHHLATPSAGWPEGFLPKPDRSEWR